jgi:hypothetical protein
MIPLLSFVRKAGWNRRRENCFVIMFWIMEIRFCCAVQFLVRKFEIWIIFEESNSNLKLNLLNNFKKESWKIN